MCSTLRVANRRLAMTPRPHPTPQQHRSRLTEQALIDAALTLFRERGVHSVTVGEIAQRAGVAPATINRRFGDKEGLHREAFRVFLDRSLEMLATVEIAADAIAGPRSLITLLAQVAAVVQGFSRENEPLLRSAYARALVDEGYASGLRELRGRVFALLRRQLLQHADEIRHPAPTLAVEFVLHQALAMLSARNDAGVLEVGALDDRDFHRELMRSLLGYLEVPSTAEQIDDALGGVGL